MKVLFKQMLGFKSAAKYFVGILLYLIAALIALNIGRHYDYSGSEFHYPSNKNEVSQIQTQFISETKWNYFDIETLDSFNKSVYQSMQTEFGANQNRKSLLSILGELHFENYFLNLIRCYYIDFIFIVIIH